MRFAFVGWSSDPCQSIDRQREGTYVLPESTVYLPSIPPTNSVAWRINNNWPKEQYNHSSVVHERRAFIAAVQAKLMGSGEIKLEDAFVCQTRRKHTHIHSINIYLPNENLLYAKYWIICTLNRQRGRWVRVARRQDQLNYRPSAVQKPPRSSRSPRTRTRPAPYPPTTDDAVLSRAGHSTANAVVSPYFINRA